MKKICLCVGARPNFIKAAPLIRAFQKHNMPYRLIYTGQHYDYNMAGIFFKELGIPKSDSIFTYNSYSERRWRICETLCYLREDCEIHKPDLIMVLGDVDSTLACALAAETMKIKLAHIEAGERCGDESMVEERNRKHIDTMSDYLFCASEGSSNNLAEEQKKIKGETHLVGNTMIDQLKYIQPLLDKTKDDKKPYAVLTLHRAENVDDLERLNKIYGIVFKIAKYIELIFVVHPRTEKQLRKLSLWSDDRLCVPRLTMANFAFKKPLPYLEFMKLINNAKFVLTDSGGLQMETSYLNVPCITLRESTEWLETVASGTNMVTGIIEEDIIKAVENILQGRWKHSKIKDMPLHDGKAAERIVELLKTL